MDNFKKTMSMVSDEGLVAVSCFFLPFSKGVLAKEDIYFIGDSLSRILFKGGYINPFERDLLEKLLLKVFVNSPQLADILYMEKPTAQMVSC